jgi:hypothetical protein
LKTIYCEYQEGEGTVDKAIVPLDGSAAVDVELPYTEECVQVDRLELLEIK